MHKIEGVHLQGANTHYEKFESKGMERVGVTDDTNQRPSSYLVGKNV